MANILHRVSIEAAPETVHELVATKEGVEKWWTARPVGGSDGVGGRLEASFGQSETPAAVFEVVEDAPEKIVWLCPTAWPTRLQRHVQ